MLYQIHQIPKWNIDGDKSLVLGEEPCIHPTATIIHSRIGAWTEIGPFTTIRESTIEDYSYVAAAHSNITYAHIGRFTSIASTFRAIMKGGAKGKIKDWNLTYEGMK
jgi:bifunctional N-acetylglucosamine-1-phosphate-uridyltransferase/glucosamine-1-phosphate-acetyltransferase GlmU-like protein